jgi:cation transport regulator ChaC
MKPDENGNSEMTRRFMRLDTEELPTLPPYNREALKAMNPRVYFVYGSLMDSATLQAVIKAREPPILRPAKIFGYHIKMWGRYPALLDSRPMLIISGMAFGIGEFEDVDQICQRLQDYEGPNYKPLQCYVQFEGDEERVRAITFEWVGDKSELKEGAFDLKDYQMRKLESNKS